MGPTETCEACGGDVDSDDAYRAEMTVGDAMCATPMVFHRDCYEQAGDIWDEGSCSAPDPEFPETERWQTFPSGSALS